MTSNPVGVGWERGTDGKLEIKWTSLLPTPEEILDIVSCDCRRECKTETCICLTNNLNCTDACHSFICDNSHNSEDDYYSNDEDDDIERLMCNLMLECNSSCIIKLKVIIKDIKFIKSFVKIGLL